MKIKSVKTKKDFAIGTNFNHIIVPSGSNLKFYIGQIGTEKINCWGILNPKNGEMESSWLETSILNQPDNFEVELEIEPEATEGN